MEDLHRLIVETVVEEPPVTLADGGVMRAGVDAELDELRELGRSGRQALAGIEERERQRTGIGSLKVRFNSVFGYYLEVTKANSRSVPADYERKQTLVNAERFTTPELKEYEAKILTAQERSGEIERRIFARAAAAAAGRGGADAGDGAAGGGDRYAGMFCTSGGAAGVGAAAGGGFGGAGVCGGDGIRWWRGGWRSRAGGGLCRTRSRWRGGWRGRTRGNPPFPMKLERMGHPRVVARLGTCVDCADYGAEYGGQEYVSAAGGAAGGDGAVRGVLCRRSGCGWGWWTGSIRGLGRATMWRGGGRRLWWR